MSIAEDGEILAGGLPRKQQKHFCTLTGLGATVQDGFGLIRHDYLICGTNDQIKPCRDVPIIKFLL